MKTNALISFAVTAKLICVFVFALQKAGFLITRLILYKLMCVMSTSIVFYYSALVWFLLKLERGLRILVSYTSTFSVFHYSDASDTHAQYFRGTRLSYFGPHLRLLPYFIQAASLENPSSAFPTRSDTKRAVQPQKMVRGLKFRIHKVEGV